MTVKPVKSEDSWRRLTVKSVEWHKSEDIAYIWRFLASNDIYLQQIVLNFSSHWLLLTAILILELDCFYCFIALLSYLRPVRRHYYQFCDFALEKVPPFGSSGWEGSSLGFECIILRRFLPLTSFYRPSNFAFEKVSPFGCSGWEGYFLGHECIMWWSVTHAVIRGVERAIWGRSGELR